MGVIIYNGISSLDYDIQVEHPPEYTTPERDYLLQSIPGRNGDLVQDNGCYKNVSRSYDIAIGSYEEEHVTLANRISEWLHSGSGYVYLEDSYQPQYYRLAMYSEGTTISNLYNHAGRSTINFNCKPQRFLKSGDALINITNNQTLTNPTDFIALPLIIIHGSGSGLLTIGSHVVSISAITNGMVLNSDMQDAYYLTSNLNLTITLSNGFPKLEAGINAISFSGGITSIDIIPKWWTL